MVKERPIRLSFLFLEECSMKTFLSAIRWISTWSGKVVSWLTIAVVCVVAYEVIMRYVFHSPTRWAGELNAFCCALIYVIGGAWVFLEKRHVKIEFVYEKMTLRQRAVIDVITFFFFALYMSLMLWATTTYAWDSIQLTENSGSPWNPPIYPIKTALVIGVFLVFLQGIDKLIRDIHFLITGKEL